MVAMLNHQRNGDGDWDDWRQGECVLPALVSCVSFVCEHSLLRSRSGGAGAGVKVRLHHR